MTSDEAVQLLLDGFVASVCGLLPVRAVWVHGSLALGDFQVGRSDFDLVAVLDGPIVDPEALCARHRSLETTHPPTYYLPREDVLDEAEGLLGC